jgi:hypothetical protein
MGARAQVYMLHGEQRGRVNEEWSQREAEAVVVERKSESGVLVEKATGEVEVMIIKRHDM